MEEEKERGEAQGSLTVIGSLVFMLVYVQVLTPLIFQSDGHVGLVVLDACVLQLGQVHLHEGTHQLLPVQGGGSALTNVAAAFWILQVTTLPLTWQLKTRIIINLPPYPRKLSSTTCRQPTHSYTYQPTSSPWVTPPPGPRP